MGFTIDAAHCLCCFCALCGAPGEIGNRARGRVAKHFSREVVAALVINRLRKIQAFISGRGNNASQIATHAGTT